MLSSGLDEVWNWKPLLKGETIMAAMQRPKGPEIGEWVCTLAPL
jgi:hypothetical protein